MTSDDDLGELEDEVRALLADPALWAEPGQELEDAVVAAIAAEAGAGPATRARARRRGPLLLAGIGTAAAVLIVVVAAVGAGSGDDDPDLRLALRATELVPGARGSAEDKTESGWRIELSATGLPRLDDGELYQAWLRDDGGTLVAIGTFNEGEDVVLWAGVSPLEYPTLTVTREEVDGDPASSGEQVLVGHA